MRNSRFYSFLERLNVRQHLREMDMNIDENADMLGIYRREFRIPTRATERHSALLR